MIIRSISIRFITSSVYALFLVGLFSFNAYAQDARSSSGVEKIWGFEDFDLGALPSGWKTNVTGKRGDEAVWQVVDDLNGAARNHVLAMATPDDGGIFGLFGRTYNIVWVEDNLFLDGEIEVKFNAISGIKDQGGGIMWRVQDKDNYYLARFNPLEENFRIYFVRNGSRQEITSANVRLSEQNWHTMKIVQRGNEFDGYLDGERLLHGSSNLFRNAGHVGLWTKTDAVTWFDDLTLRFAE